MEASPTYAELIARIEALEAGPSLDQLPLAALQRKLETDWQPESSALLLPKSIGSDLLTDAATTKAKLAPDALSAFLKLLVAADLKLAHGSDAVQWNGGTGSNVRVVSHGLGVTPLRVKLTWNQDLGQVGSLFCSARDATTFSVVGRAAGGVGSGGTTGFDWEAIG